MDKKEFGNLIYQIRKSQEMTQAELANNICSIKELSRIEKGNVAPNLNTFEQLLSRLGINLFERLHHSLNSDLVWSRDTAVIRELIHTCGYDAAKSKLSLLKSSVLYAAHPLYQQFVRMVDSILTNELSKKPKEALKSICEALEITFSGHDQSFIEYKSLTEQECQILHCIAIFHLSAGNYQEGLERLLQLKKKLRTDATSIHMLPAICYNLAKTYGILGYYKNSIHTCSTGIEYCGRLGTLRPLAELYYCKACSLFFDNEIEAAEENYKSSCYFSMYSVNAAVQKKIESYQDAYQYGIRNGHAAEIPVPQYLSQYLYKL